MILVEFLNSFGDRGPRLRQAAATAVEALRSNRNRAGAATAKDKPGAELSEQDLFLF